MADGGPTEQPNKAITPLGHDPSSVDNDMVKTKAKRVEGEDKSLSTNNADEATTTLLSKLDCAIVEFDCAIHIFSR